MNAPPPPIDIVSLAIALAGLIFGQELAQMIGPYAVIMMGASLGAVISASRLEPGTGMHWAAHLGFFVTLALLVTVPLAYWLERQLGFESKWLFGPVAILVAGIGQDWPLLVRWALGQARRLAEGWVTRRGGNNAGGDQP